MVERLLPVARARVVSVIETHSYRGSNTPQDPMRLVFHYWTHDGDLLAEHDTLPAALAGSACGDGDDATPRKAVG